MKTARSPKTGSAFSLRSGDKKRASGKDEDSADPTTADPASTNPAVSFPEVKSDVPGDEWEAYFSKHRPTGPQIGALILKLHEQKQHEHAIAVIEACLRNGQSQPWMYEVLAISMEHVGRPKEDIERVVLSLTDFGQVDFASMLYSAAYLSRFGRHEQALLTYQQASRMSPEQPEPYVLGLRAARQAKHSEGICWAACGILQYAWLRNFEQVQRDAQDAALDAVQSLAKSGKKQQAEDWSQKIAAARRRDLIIELKWNGTADLDLEIEEPNGTICSQSSPETSWGGLHVRDGFGPKPENCVEKYVCVYGAKGDYKVQVKKVWGDLVGGRAELTITRDAGSPQQQVTRETLHFKENLVTTNVALKAGRRVEPRTLPNVDAAALLKPISVPDRRLARREDRDEEAANMVRDFSDSRLGNEIRRRQRTLRQQNPGVGFQPVIITVPSGVQLSTIASVSADRRYVRLSINPFFSSLTDVFTFSFVSVPNGQQGGGGAGGGGGGGGGGGPMP